jgi:predicted Rossmann fold flavoprotein
MTELYDTLVIGAGPAGLSCAIHAALPGRHILLLEKNPGPGNKLLLAGSGQCNVTHTGDIQDFLSHYGDHGKFLKPALFSFPSKALIAFFTTRGLGVETDANGKIFPETRKSADVLALLVKECRQRGIDLRCAEPATCVTRTTGGFGISTPKATYHSPVLVITTGGASYPETGSTGDGFRFSASLGQPVTDIAPALTPLKIQSFPFAALSGISFEHLHFSVWRAGKKIADYQGDVLFTHLGLSGPGILDASRDIQPGDVVRLSFVGTMSREEFAADLTQRAEKHRIWQLATLLAAYPIPERLNRKLLELSGIPVDLTCAHFSAAQRSKLVRNCTEFPLIVSAPGDFSVAMVTRGGVALEHVNPKTMESGIVPDLYFAGEVLDIDGDTGGYNIQAAFSTGYLAAVSIRKRWGRG